MKFWCGKLRALLGIYIFKKTILNIFGFFFAIFFQFLLHKNWQSLDRWKEKKKISNSPGSTM